MSLKEWVTVVPGPGNLRQVAGELLAVADDPRHVRTTNGGQHFLVHPLVAEKFNNAAPAPKSRRGRRPKAENESEASE